MCLLHLHRAHLRRRRGLEGIHDLLLVHLRVRGGHGLVRLHECEGCLLGVVGGRRGCGGGRGAVGGRRGGLLRSNGGVSGGAPRAHAHLCHCGHHGLLTSGGSVGFVVGGDGGCFHGGDVDECALFFLGCLALGFFLLLLFLLLLLGGLLVVLLLALFDGLVHGAGLHLALVLVARGGLLSGCVLRLFFALVVLLVVVWRGRGLVAVLLESAAVV
mmetsp:Transcript_10152/g.25440  ORF Transcript_10152/g.25440 Transcript_10152/m.25440 type:complete len:215 (+) Transcript_10152:1416-2060(+)